MLETFTVETFQPRVGEPFRVIVDEQWELRATLAEVNPWGGETAKHRPRQPFTLVFRAAPEARLPQGTYRVENENLEPFELFLVPVQPDAQGTRFEAVFT